MCETLRHLLLSVSVLLADGQTIIVGAQTLRARVNRLWVYVLILSVCKMASVTSGFFRRWAYRFHWSRKVRVSPWENNAVCWDGMVMHWIVIASQVAVHCALQLWPSVTALFRAQCSRSDQFDYVMIVINGRASGHRPSFSPQSCSDSLYLTTYEMVYKLNGYKSNVKVFLATSSYVETPAIINDCNVGHIIPVPTVKPMSNRTYGCALVAATKGPETFAVHSDRQIYCICHDAH